jgi:hypothetical protein
MDCYTLLMNDEFIQNAKSWGEEGEKWLANIPTIITEYKKSGHLKCLPLTH